MPESLFDKLYEKRDLAQVFSCEFCEISKNTFFHRAPPVASGGIFLINIKICGKHLTVFNKMKIHEIKVQRILLKY